MSEAEAKIEKYSFPELYTGHTHYKVYVYACTSWQRLIEKTKCGLTVEP